MLQPKKRKYRKEFRGTMKGNALRGNELAFGDYGLKALTGGWVRSQQIEAARRTISHHTKRLGKTFIRIFPHKPFTKRAAGSRMGSGKGDIEGYVAVIRPGTILFELTGVSSDAAQQALHMAGHKLSLRTKIITRP